MSETTVVNIKTCGPNGYDVYIGRAMPRQGLAGSIFANPFKIGRDGTREDVLAKYRAHVLNITGLSRFLREIQGKRLACWCAPLACHGDILASMADRPSRPTDSGHGAGGDVE